MTTFRPGPRFTNTKPPRVGSLAWFDPDDGAEQYVLPFIKPASVVQICQPPDWMLDGYTHEPKMEVHVSWCKFARSESVVPVSSSHLRRIHLSRKAFETLEDPLLDRILQLIEQ